MSLLDFIYPKKCINCRKFGEYLCPDCFAKIRYNDNFYCPMCGRPSVNGLTHLACQKPYGLDGIWTITVYNNIVKKLIYQFENQPNLSKLAAIISGLMIEGLIQNEIFYKFLEDNNPVVIPIPVDKKKLREIGYGPSELLTSYVAQYFKLKMSSKLLININGIKSYGQRSREKDVNNKNEFEVYKNSKIPKFIILIDVKTKNFFTLKEAAKVLKQKGARKVIAVTFVREAVR